VIATAQYSDLPVAGEQARQDPEAEQGEADLPGPETAVYSC
jgi:hypothetical protein